MSFSTVTKPPRGQMKCNICRANCLIKNGDWFVSDGSSGQQIFLCKVCEKDTKGVYKRAALNYKHT